MNREDLEFNDDAQFESLLLEYDEALGASTPHEPVTNANFILNERLAGAQRCLRLLHRRWPRASVAVASGGSSDKKTFGRFVMERELGRGGFGIVYLAFDPMLQRQVALKLPRPDVLASSDAHRRFIHEGQTAARLHHPNLVTVLEAGEVGPVCYLATEYCAGPTLAAWRKSQTAPIDPRLTTTIVLALADAAGYLHEQGIVHRDIKPGNILLSEPTTARLVPGNQATPFQLVPKLTDFGLAKSNTGESLHTRPGSPLGTPAYMAPEQAGGANQDADPAADVYALGVILYELLAGTNPFAAGSDVETFRRHLELDAPPLRSKRRDIPRDLETICLKCLEKEPARRYATSRALHADLQRHSAGRPLWARRPTLVQRWLRIVRHNAATSTLAIVAVCLIAAWATTVASRRTDHGSALASKANGETAAPLQESSGGNSGPIPAPPGLIAWWSGDGNTRDLAADNHGKLMNGASFAPGLIGQAFSLDGIDDYVRIPNSEALNPLEGITIEGWVCSNTKGVRNIVAKWDVNTQDYSYCLQDRGTADSSNHKLVFMLSQNSRTNSRFDLAELSAHQPIIPGVWMHVAATFDENRVKLYCNGTLDANDEVRGHVHRGTTDVLIGAAVGRTTNWYFSGLIDELCLYDRALSVGEIRAIYDAGAAGKIKPAIRPHSPSGAHLRRTSQQECV